MTQTEMFPKTTMEILEGLAEVHRDEYNKAAKALGDLDDDEKIARRYEKAEERVTKSRDQVQAIDMLIRRERERAPAEVAVEIVNSGALDTDGLAVTASVSPGRVADSWTCPDCAGDLAWYDKTGHTCTTCDGTGHQDPSCDNCTGYGDCNISQRPGSDTMGCGGKSWLHGDPMDEVTDAGAVYLEDVASMGANSEAVNAPEPNVSVVIVLYPGQPDDPVVTKIGEHTRYGELVAGYFSALGESDKHDAKDWTVVAEDELTNPATAYGARKLRDVIAPADYGKRLLVVAADQGSVTGADDQGGAS